MDGHIRAEVAEQAVEIERQLGAAKLRRIAGQRVRGWLRQARTAERKKQSPEHARQRAYWWCQVYVGRLPARGEDPTTPAAGQ